MDSGEGNRGLAAKGRQSDTGPALSTAGRVFKRWSASHQTDFRALTDSCTVLLAVVDHCNFAHTNSELYGDVQKQIQPVTRCLATRWLLLLIRLSPQMLVVICPLMRLVH